MNITFMIGNGFDLNLGLKTKYTDFYPIYEEKFKNDILANHIKDNYEKWADLEASLGKYLKNITDEDFAYFIQEKGNMENCLAYHLGEEEKKIKIKDENILINTFIDSVLNYKMFMSTEERTSLINIENIPERINYWLVTFNYTRLLDKFVELTKPAFDGNVTHKYASSTYQCILNNPVHVHGTLEENMILAVNDIYQIDNERLRENPDFCDLMIKESLNSSIGERRTETVETIIDNSKIICLYGLSIGDTDKRWWEYLINWLCKSASNRLILFNVDFPAVEVSASVNGLKKGQYRSEFFKKSGIEDESIYNEIKNQIYVLNSGFIFDFSEAIEIKEEEKGRELVNV